MQSCLFCNTDLCTCVSKINTRLLFLAEYLARLKLYYATHQLSKSDLQIWFMMYEQGKAEKNKIELLIKYKTYVQRKNTN